MTWIDELVERFGFWRNEEQPWSPPSDADYARLEAAVGGVLPAEYRYYLANFGGGLLGNQDFTVEAPITEPCPWGDRVGPELFYPLLPAHRDNLEDQLHTYRGRIPGGVLAISRDAGGNEVCLDIAGRFPGSVWFWDHEQRWFKGNLQDAADELKAAGENTRTMSVHDIVRGWARLHADELDRPADYMGMYRMAPSFAEFLRSLHQVAY